MKCQGHNLALGVMGDKTAGGKMSVGGKGRYGKVRQMGAYHRKVTGRKICLSKAGEEAGKCLEGSGERVSEAVG